MTTNSEQLRTDFETWWKDRQVAVSIKEDAFAAYQAGRAALQSHKPEPNNLMLLAVIRMPFEMAMADPISRMQFYQRAQQSLNELEVMQSQTVIDDDHLSIVLDVYDNAMQKAFDGREFKNPCKLGTPEHKAWEKGSKEGKKKRDAGLPNSIALQSQDREDASKGVDAAMESVRKQFCALPRYSFIVRKGGVSRIHDSTGNWIEFEQAHALFDPVNVDHARRIEEMGENK